MPYVKDKVQIDRVLEEAAANNAVICYTIVSPELREHMADRALAKDVEVSHGSPYLCQAAAQA